MTSFLVALVLAVTGPAQSRPYAKFDGDGRIIGLFNLGSVEGCRELHSVIGTSRNVRSQIRRGDLIFSFTLVGGGRHWTVGFSLKSDAIDRGDIEALLVEKQSVRASIRMCAGGWIATDITRQ